jgi:hypothetical protein
MYTKPRLERFGTLRELTLVGWNADCDGGIFGIGDGSNVSEFFGFACNNNRS